MVYTTHYTSETVFYHRHNRVLEWEWKVELKSFCVHEAGSLQPEHTSLLLKNADKNITVKHNYLGSYLQHHTNV